LRANSLVAETGANKMTRGDRTEVRA